METTTCKQCGESFDFTPIEGLPFTLKPTICGDCDERNKASDAAQVQAKMHQHWRAMCPEVYQNTDPNHPGMPPAHKQAKVLNWEYGPKGLILVGPSRKGKTRLMWMLLKRLVLEGRLVRATACSEFAAALGWAWGEGAQESHDLVDEWCTADVLFIDDLGKSKLTERVESELFNVVEHRTSHGKPLLFTSNFVGETLEQKMSPDRGPAIVSRIREFCKSISL